MCIQRLRSVSQCMKSPNQLPHSGIVFALTVRFHRSHSHKAFTLVAVLAVLALLMVLVVSIASVMHVETRISATSKDLLVARNNALLGLQTAMAELQKYAGSDQAVTFSATTYYPEKDVTTATGPLYDDDNFGFRRFAQTSSQRSYLNKVETYLTRPEREQWDTALKDWWNEGDGRNPHWTGIMDTSLRVDRATNPLSDPVDLAPQRYEDAVVSGGQTLFGEPKRDQLPVWLVSGNEKYQINQATGEVLNSNGNVVSTDAYPSDYSTPDSILPNPQNDQSVVWLVGEGSSADLDESDADQAVSGDGLDGRVKVKKVAIPKVDANGNPVADNGESVPAGHYAYWVGDESQKANFAVRDPYFTATEESIAYRNRLQSPQRVGWENLDGFDAATFNINSEMLENISSANEIGLLEETNTEEIKRVSKENFHSLTAYSRSLLTDTALGGLKKDLTQFLEEGDGIIGDASIADPRLYDTDDPRFAAWNGSNTGFPGDTLAELNGIPTWDKVRQWYQNEATSSGAIYPNAETAPVISYIMLHGGWSYHGPTKRVRWHWLPCVILWNPYDVPLASGSYELEIGVYPSLWKGMVCKPDPTMAERQAVSPEANWTQAGADTTFIDTNDNVQIMPTPQGDDNFPDNLNLEAGPFPKDTDSSNGGTDAIGRLWYKLKDIYDPTVSFSEANNYFGSGNPRTPTSAMGFLETYANRISPNQGGHWDPNNDNAELYAMRFQIVGSFGPGEVKVFTVPTTQEWDKKGAPIEMLNEFEYDQPASIWFDFMELADGPANSNGDLRYFFGQIANTKAAPIVRFTIGNETIMEAREALGSIRYNNMMGPINGSAYGERTGYNDGGNSDYDGDGKKNREEQVPKFVDQWRKLYDFDQFESQVLAQDTPNHNSSIWPYGVTWIQPLTTGGGLGGDQIASYVPVFSRFNLGAKNWDAHPLVDSLRSQDGENNTNYLGNYEGLNRLFYIRSDYDSSQKWDANQTDGLNGYALITPDGTDSNYQALSQLPVRNAKRANSEILSLGQLQQVNLSPYFWQPAFPIGNSFASPYVDREAIAGIHSRRIGVSTNLWVAMQNAGQTPGAPTSNHGFEGMLELADGREQYVPGNSFLDVSYLLNENIWDRYFLSTIADTPDLTAPLANSRHRFTELAVSADNSDLKNFDLSAAYLENLGALNINSTSVAAWTALLTAFRDLYLEGAGQTNPAETMPISRTLDPILGPIEYEYSEDSSGNLNSTIDSGDSWTTNSNRDYAPIVGGFRYLTDDMIVTLAERIVDEIRLRGPFLSLSDFVNRRLVKPDGAGEEDSPWMSARTTGMVGSPENPDVPYTENKTLANEDNNVDFMDVEYDPFIGLQGLSGTLQRAIQVSGINGGVNDPRLGFDGADNGERHDRVYGVRIKSGGDEEYSNNNNLLFGGSNPIGGTNNRQARHTQDPSFRYHLDTEHIASAPVGEAGQLFDGTPGFLTQGDLLAMIGPALTPRGDTFLIRTYGDAVGQNGEILARAWLEAVVQRVVEPVTPAGATGEQRYQYTDRFGRKFEIKKLRWLNAQEL